MNEPDSAPAPTSAPLPLHKLLLAVFRRPTETFTALRTDPPLKPAVSLLFGSGTLAALCYWYIPLTGTLRMADLNPLLSMYPIVAGTGLLLLSPAVLSGAAAALGGSGGMPAGIAATSLLVSGLFLFQVILGLLARNLIAVGALSIPFSLWLAWLCFVQMRTLHELSKLKAAAAVGVVVAVLGGLWIGGSFILNGPALRRVAELQAMAAASKTVSWPAEIQPGTGQAKVNAADIYKQAESAARKLSDQERDAITQIAVGGWPRRGAPQLEAVLAKNQQALAIFRKAAYTPFCDFTFGHLKTVFPDTPFYPLPATLNLARLLMLEARIKEAKGDYDGAIEDAIVVLLYNRHVAAQRNNALISTMVSKVVLDTVWPQLSSIAGAGAGSPAAMRKLFQTLDYWQKGRTPLGEVMRIDTEINRPLARLMAQSIQVALRPAAAAKVAEDSAKIVQEGQDSLVLAAEKNEPAIYSGFFDRLRKTEPEMFQADGAPSLFHCYTHPDTAGRCLGLVPLFQNPQFGKLICQFQLTAARVAVLKSAVGIRLGLKQLPPDPFNGFQPLRFAAAKDGTWVVYSLGPDRKDDAGAVSYDKSYDEDAEIANPSPGDVVIRGRPAPAAAHPARKPAKKKRRR